MDDAWLERIEWGGDVDGDGLDDGWEVAHFGGSDLADADADSDGDGASEYAEFRAGTDPQDASSVLALCDVDEPESGVVIRWPSAAGITYAIDRAIDLAEGFAPYRTGIAATPPENVFRDTNAASAFLYYRIRVE